MGNRFRSTERIKHLRQKGTIMRASSGKRITAIGWETNSRTGTLVPGTPAAPGEFLILDSDGFTILSTGTLYEGAGDGSTVLANDGTYSADYAHRLGVPFVTPMDWRDRWAPGTYDLGDTVVDGSYTMVANTTTTDKPAPVADGAAGWLLPQAPTWTLPSLAGVVYSGHEYTVDGLLFVDGVRCWRPEITEVDYVLVAQDYTNPSAPILIGSANIPIGTLGWFEFNVVAALYDIGAVLRVTLVSERTIGETSFTRPWGYVGLSLNVDPGTGNYARSAAQIELYISKTDSNVADASADLATLTDGDRLDLVETATPARYENYRVVGIPVDNGTYYTFGVTLTDQGSAIRSGSGVTISGYAAGGDPTVYNVLPDWWLTNDPDSLTVKGFVSQDPNSLTFDDSAYGVDLRGNTFSVSPDWDVLASSSGGGGGTSPAVQFDGAYALNVADTHTVVAPSTWEEFVPTVAVTTRLSGMSYAAGRLQFDTPGTLLEEDLVINASIKIPGVSQQIAVGFGLNGVPGAFIEMIKAVAGSAGNPSADVVQNLVVTVPKSTSSSEGDNISIFIWSSIANVLDVISLSLFVDGHAQ